jgi:putative transcriptional regulator
MKNRLRVIRAERQWSQKDLAELLEVSRQTVNAIETGRYAPSLPLAFKIARLVGQSIEDIFDPPIESGAACSIDSVRGRAYLVALRLATSPAKGSDPCE